MTGIEKAVKQAGSQGQLAEKLGVSQQVVSVWVRRGYVPEERALQIEKAYGIPRAELLSPRLRNLVGLDD